MRIGGKLTARLTFGVLVQCPVRERERRVVAGRECRRCGEGGMVSRVERCWQHSTTQRNSEECCFPHLPCPGPGLLASAGWRVETQRCATISARAYLCDQHRTKQLAAESNNMSLACLVTLSDTDTGDRNKRCGDHHTHRMFLIGRVNAAHYTVG